MFGGSSLEKIGGQSGQVEDLGRVLGVKFD